MPSSITTRCCALLLVLLATGLRAQTLDKYAEHQNSPRSPSLGQSAFASRCAGCHGLDGRGGGARPILRPTRKCNDCRTSNCSGSSRMAGRISGCRRFVSSGCRKSNRSSSTYAPSKVAAEPRRSRATLSKVACFLSEKPLARPVTASATKEHSSDPIFPATRTDSRQGRFVVQSQVLIPVLHTGNWRWRAHGPARESQEQFETRTISPCSCRRRTAYFIS